MDPEPVGRSGCGILGRSLWKGTLGSRGWELLFEGTAGRRWKSLARLKNGSGRWWSWQVSGLQPYPTTLNIRLRGLNLALGQQRSNGARGGGPGGPGEDGEDGIWRLGWRQVSAGKWGGGALAPLDWCGHTDDQQGRSSCRCGCYFEYIEQGC